MRELRQTSFASRFVQAHYRGRCVEQRWRFVARELTGRHTVGRYRPRGFAIDVLLRHNTTDVVILEEFNDLGLYKPPQEIDQRLRSLGRSLRILDLGGHIGIFGAWALTRYPGASLVSLEPDPANFSLLKATAQASGRSWQGRRGGGVDQRRRRPVLDL